MMWYAVWWSEAISWTLKENHSLQILIHIHTHTHQILIHIHTHIPFRYLFISILIFPSDTYSYPYSYSLQMLIHILTYIPFRYVLISILIFIYTHIYIFIYMHTHTQDTVNHGDHCSSYFHNIWVNCGKNGFSIRKQQCYVEALMVSTALKRFWFNGLLRSLNECG